MNNKKVGLLIQVILVVFILALLFLSVYEQIFLIPLKIALSLEMFVLAYNNYTVYKRKYVLYLYLLAGISFLIAAILEMI